MSLGPPSPPPPEVKENSIKEADREVYPNHSWNARKRVIIRGMEDELGRSGDVMVVGELESYLLACPVRIGRYNHRLGRRWLQEVCTRGGGYSRIAVCGSARKSGKLQEAIEFMNAKQKRLLATLVRLQKLMSGAAEEIQRRVLQDVMVLEDKVSEVEHQV